MTPASENPREPAGKGGSLRTLLGLLDRPSRVRLALAAVVSGLLALLETVAIVMVLPLVSIATGAPLDEGVVGTVWRLLGEPERGAFGLMLVIVVVCLFIAKDVLAMVFAWWQSGFVAAKRVEMSTALFRGFLREPFAEFRHRNIGEAMRTMSAAVGQVFSSVNAIITFVAAGLTVLAIMAALLVTTPLQALLAIAYFGIAALLYLRVVRPRVNSVGDAILEGSREWTIAGMQGLQGFKEVKLRHSAGYFVDRYRDGLSTNEYAAREGNFFSSITKYLLEILFILGVGALLLQSFATGSAGAAVGSLAVFVAAGFRLLPNISGLVAAVNTFRMGSSSIDLVARELSASAGRAEPTPAGSEPIRFEEELRIEDLRFRYPGATEDVLRGIDLVIQKGSSIAFVGSSGAGKTTLVDVMLGLLEPCSGRLLADGTDLAPRIEDWQRACAMVAQDVFVAENTVRKNVLFDVAPEEADQERLQEAVGRAQLQDVVDALPGGLDGDVGDWGARLSGGQRQRIGIARALYRRPSLLVLDEATSALDNETERRITETIESLHGEVTVVVVAHRLSTVRGVDMVVYLEDGKVSAAGSFDDLRDRSPGFRRLVELGDLGGEGGVPAT